jgi:transposase
MYIMKSEGEPGRRHHDRALKARLVELSLQPGASASAIAREHGINANLLFTWRREFRRAETSAGSTESAVLLPVKVAPPAEVMTMATSIGPTPPQSRPAPRNGVIELEFAGAQLRLRGAIDEDSLCSVLRALREST